MTTPLTLHIVSIQRGPIAPLGPEGVPSGFVKQPVAGRVAVGALGLEGDGTADLRVHGGPDKAVYAYPAAHHDAWRADVPGHAAAWGPGAVGENLTLDGALEDQVRIGDILQGADGLALQVTQPRQPCFKFALRWGDEQLPPAMTMNGRCGWYLRVLQAGSVAAGDRLERVAEGDPDWTIARFQALTTRERRRLTERDLAAMVDLAPLAAVWREWAAERLAQRRGR